MLLKFSDLNYKIIILLLFFIKSPYIFANGISLEFSGAICLPFSGQPLGYEYQSNQTNQINGTFGEGYGFSLKGRKKFNEHVAINLGINRQIGTEKQFIFFSNYSHFAGSGLFDGL
jgi:hypothetical protein